MSSSQLELYSADTYDIDDDVFTRASASDLKTGMPNENSRPHEANTSRMLRSRTYDMISDCTKPGGLNSHGRPHMNGLYTSGTRSAYGSRSVSPDIHRMRTSISPVRKLVPFPEPPPSFLLPRTNGKLQSPVRSINTDHLTSATTNERDNIAPVVAASSSGQRSSRPKTLTKSLSIDATLITSHTSVKQLHPEQSSSATCSPVANIPSLLFTPALIAEGSAPLRQDVRLKPETDRDALIIQRGGSLERLSPRSARKKFFEEDNVSSTLLVKPDAQHIRQSSLPNQQDLPTTSWTDRVNMIESVEQAPSSFQTANNIPNPVAPPKAYQGHTHTGAKEKRKFFKKAASLDSSVMSGLAGVGVQMIPPAVPSGFTPHDLFAAVKRKLRPGVKRSLAHDDSHVAHEDSHARLTPIRDQSFEKEAVTDPINQQPTPSNSSHKAPFQKSNDDDLTKSSNKQEAPSIVEKCDEPVKGKVSKLKLKLSN